MGLSGKVWPVHLKPLHDELLSSWIIRLAHANGLKVMTLSTILFGYRQPIWNRDIDKLAPQKILGKLSQITGTPIEKVTNTTLKGFEGNVFEKLNSNGNTRWILPLGIYHRSRHGFGLQFCPQCLKEDPAPYFRRAWRIGFITACTKHNLVLIDRCPTCQAPITPHRTDMMDRTSFPGKRLISRCTYCGDNLENAEISAKVDVRILSIQRIWEQAMHNGWINWAGNPSMYAFLFFDGLRNLCTGLTKQSDRNRLTGCLKPIQQIMRKWPANGIEFASVESRHALLAEIAELLDAWPDRFLLAATKNHLRYSSLQGRQNNQPFWYENVLRNHLMHRPAPITQIEADAMVNFIEFHHGEFNNRLACKLYGRDISKLTIHYSYFPASLDTSEQLLASIDHEIGGTLDKIKRLELLRDKVMFALARVLHLSTSKLSKITIEDVRSMIPICVQPNFAETPMDLQQARAWAEWYFLKVRPHLKPDTTETKLFTSSRTHHGLKRSIISFRFNRAVKASYLHRRIHSYSNWRN